MIGGTDMTETVERPNYYAIIPASVRYDNNLPGKASLLYGEITALCNQKGYCWASDSYFADLYGVAKSTIQTWLKALEINGHISRDVIYKEGTREIEHRYIRISVGGIPKNQSTPTPKNQRDNNTSINTTVNNTSNKKHSAANATPLVQLEKDFEEIWQAYPNKKGKGQAFNHYKAWRKKSVDHTNEYLFNKLDRYKQYIKLNSNWYHPLNGATWFNGRFDDELDLTPKPQNRGYQKNTRKEIIPQWAKDQKAQYDSNHGTNNHISDDDRKRLADRLAKLESKGG
ncbi:helix-turn-helix domain-containing protein [Lactiplantibacillus plantarum]|uniref:helix-turn-helix domain-containing protein n=2 Tax=Lactiplantibacillus plantarum TaxID=1590 RepID=UPI001BAD98FC|nr:helix-turn-helix domain-containing protein [Lactiplantibacillus plantarum]MBS0944652.1 helix-turn-helix domain-containing protein [Lactiplantibacillus plantarum]